MTVAVGEPPSPGGVRTIDELSARLRALQTWAGASYREIHRRVLRSRQERGVTEQPAFNTIYRCLSAGRRRLDVELVVDIARVLLRDEASAAEWRQAHQVVSGLAADAAVVRVADSVEAEGSCFVGRTAAIDAALCAIRGGGRLVLIEGMPGVGKTTLATHLANHLVGGDELQLSVNLRGYDPVRPPADPAAVLDGFLRRLGMSGSRIHGMDLAARSAAFRELVHGRRTVVLLDNAASDDQVQPLLADSPDCVSLVTSRRSLTVSPGAYRIRLDVFEPTESAALLRRAAGAATVDREPTVAVRLAELVGHLPLALAVLVSRIKAQPSWRLADHLERLVEHLERLRLDDGVAAALSMSYQALPISSRRMLRLIALHPGRDFDASAGAALAGVPLAEAQEQLTALVQANLLQARAAGRYELHDLVRLLASDRARDEDTASVRRSAVTRLLEFYISATAKAAVAYAPHDRDRIALVRDPDEAALDFADRDAGRAWLDAERHNLSATALYAAGHGRAAYTTGLSVMLQYYLDTAGRYYEAEALHLAALRCATSDRDRGRAYNGLGGVYWRLGRYTAGRSAYEQALELARRAGNRAGEASGLSNVALGHFRLGNYPDSIVCQVQAYELFVAEGNKSGATSALAGLGWGELRLGRHQDALEHFEQELATCHELGEATFEESYALANIGAAKEALGLLSEAEQAYQAAAELARQLRFAVGESDALNGLGRSHLAAGRIEQAVRCHREALEIVLGVGSRPFAIEVRNDYGRALYRAGRRAAALEQHRQALTDAEAIEDRYELGRACASLAEILAAQGGSVAAADYRRRALELFTDLRVPEAAGIHCPDGLLTG